MTRRCYRRHWPTVGLLFSMVIAPPTARAQGHPTGEVAGGYQLMADTDLAASPFPAGWFVSVAQQVSDQVALTGEVAASHHLTLYTFMGGVRLAFGETVRPFVHLLAGVAHLARPNDSGLPFFAVQPGGGVDIPVTRTVATRFVVDYRRLVDEDAGHQVRVAAGIVVGWGHR